MLSEWNTRTPPLSGLRNRRNNILFVLQAHHIPKREVMSRRGCLYSCSVLKVALEVTTVDLRVEVADEGW